MAAKVIHFKKNGSSAPQKFVADDGGNNISAVLSSPCSAGTIFMPFYRHRAARKQYFCHFIVAARRGSNITQPTYINVCTSAPMLLSFFACFHFCALCAVTIDENMFAAYDSFKVRWFGTELHIIVNEFGNDRVFSVGQNESHLFILLGNDGHEAQVVDIDIGRAQEVV